MLTHLWSALAVLALATQFLLAQEPQTGVRGQPLGEAEVARAFKEAAPELFQQWLDLRPELLKKRALGVHMKASAGRPGGKYFIIFTECTDIVPPSEYRIDVTRTDSILWPYLGHLYVPVRESCTPRAVTPKGISKWDEKIALLARHCVGNTFEECLKVEGGKPVSESNTRAITSRSGTFTAEREEIHVVYGWTQEKWEFQEERQDEPTKGGSED